MNVNMIFSPGAGKKRRTADCGFTLLEVLVAVVILGLAYVTALQSFSLSMRNISRVEEKRGEIADALLDFEERGRFVGADIEEGEDEDEDGALFLEGHKYNLLVIIDREADLTTLTLERSL